MSSAWNEFQTEKCQVHVVDVTVRMFSNQLISRVINVWGS